MCVGDEIFNFVNKVWSRNHKIYLPTKFSRHTEVFGINFLYVCFVLKFFVNIDCII